MKEGILPSQLPYIVIEPDHKWLNFNLQDLWIYRELLFFLVWRDIKVRYKQTALGATWAILQPLLTMVVFSVVFGRLAGLPSEGVPYPIFTFTALLPWQLFAHALSDSSNSLVGNERLITKVYFPRLVIPISSVLGGLVDFVLAFVVLLGIMLFYGVPFTLRLLVLPPLVLLAIFTATAIGLWLSALNVQYRDVRYTVPFLTQLWMFATPIAYSSTLIPEKWRWVLGLNPLAGVVEGFRWALLGLELDVSGLLAVSLIILTLLLVGGLVYFKRVEDSFADVI